MATRWASAQRAAATHGRASERSGARKEGQCTAIGFRIWAQRSDLSALLRPPPHARGHSTPMIAQSREGLRLRLLAARRSTRGSWRALTHAIPHAFVVRASALSGSCFGAVSYGSSHQPDSLRPAYLPPPGLTVGNRLGAPTTAPRRNEPTIETGAPNGIGWVNKGDVRRRRHRLGDLCLDKFTEPCGSRGRPPSPGRDVLPPLLLTPRTGADEHATPKGGPRAATTAPKPSTGLRLLGRAVGGSRARRRVIRNPRMETVSSGRATVRTRGEHG